jgi:hypothetical protein
MPVTATKKKVVTTIQPTPTAMLSRRGVAAAASVTRRNSRCWARPAGGGNS